MKNCIYLVLMALVVTGCTKSYKKHELADKSLSSMIHIKGGTFEMGTNNLLLWGSGDGRFPHKVKLSSFYMSKTNVSYENYDSYTEITGQTYLNEDLKIKDDPSRKENRPVAGATWPQADSYCKYLKKETGLPFDLPTDAQWEYTARNLGKSDWTYATDNGKKILGKNYPSNEQLSSQPISGIYDKYALPVGSIPCTPQGICGMTGEVDQWMKDWASDDNDPFSDKVSINPQGDKYGMQKVLRGGVVNNLPEDLTNYFRYSEDTGDDGGEKYTAGFRCVINSTKPMSELKTIAKKQLSN